MPDCPHCGHGHEEQPSHCTQCGAELSCSDPTATAAIRAAEHRGPVSGVHGRFVPGTRLGTRYRIVGLLGSGGMGEVYRADDLELGQSVALKFLPARLSTDAAALARLRNEVRTARQIAHPNVCRIYDIAEVDRHVFLSMEFIDGEDLAGVLRRLGRPSPEKAIEIARQICLGIGAAHENNVLHRDLKPANIMIDGRGRVRITDFGLAGFLDELEQADSRAGTPAYMAPEQISNGPISVRSDIYSLGLIFYELFTGHRALNTTDVNQPHDRRGNRALTWPSSLADTLDSAIELIIMRCLEHQPEQRPQSVYQVLAALPGGDPLVAALAAGETPSPELVANARDAGGLRPPVAVGLITTLLAMMGILYLYYTNTTVMPQRTPAVLSVVAEQTLHELGYAALPGHTVSSYGINDQLGAMLKHTPRSRTDVESMRWPPKFYYWRRWTDGHFIPLNFHFPEAHAHDGAVAGATWTASTVFDSTGRLLRLHVETPSAPDNRPSPRKTDWSPLFELSRFDESRATRVPLHRPPPVHCDDTTAWEVELDVPDGSSIIMQMGAVDGILNYFEILDCLHIKSVPSASFMEMWWGIFEVLIIVLAVRNLRAGRGDRRNAFRCALFVGALYALLELLALRPSESGFLMQLRGLQNGRAAGHIILHALNVWLIYMAIEPYVRRFYPRMLVSTVRLLSARLNDPAVGRELLIGIVTGCGLCVGIALLSWADWAVQVDNTWQLPSWTTLLPMISPERFVTSQIHYVAWAMLDAAYYAGYLIVFRFITRRTNVAFALTVIFIGADAAAWSTEFMDATLWTAVVYGTLFGLAGMLLFTRVGVVSIAMAFFVMRSSTAISINFDSPLAAYGYAGFATWLAIALYGFWIALAGQPIFKDILAEPHPSRR